MTVTMRCTTEVINVVRPAISNLYVDWPVTAVPWPVKAHCPGHLTICNTRMPTSQPTSRSCITPIYGWTWRSHPFTPSTVKSKPSRTDGIITIIVIIGVGYLSVSTVKGSVVLAFRRRMPARSSISCEWVVAGTTVGPYSVCTWSKLVAAVDTAGTLIDISTCFPVSWISSVA